MTTDPTDTMDPIEQWLDRIFSWEIQRRGTLPTLDERTGLRERLRPLAKRASGGDLRDVMRLYGHLRQGIPQGISVREGR
jgi:hypothetical protein